MLLYARRQADSTEPAIEIPDTPQVTLALLQSARTEVRSQAIGNRAWLAWKELAELHGDESMLRKRIEQLKAVAAEGNDELLQLSDRYLSGWRPKDFGRG